MKSTAVSRRQFLAVTALATLCRAAGEETNKTPFAQRGYYLLPDRTPTLGLNVYKDLVDCAAEDGANVLVLWMAGGFRSKKFPITWQHNKDHANVREDFMGEVIRHAHLRGIRVLLGFSPFAYDGVNRYPAEHPELKAIGNDGQPVSEMGIDCWGWNLCPSRAESQRFMIEYVREMAFDFYPEADGLFIESSDYSICHCPDCGAHYYEKEFAFVKAISEETWNRNADATVVVYPHYFSGAKLGFANATAAKLPFDKRWTLFFTPHSAALDPGLIAQASGSWWWNEAPSRFHIGKTRNGAQIARDARCTGFLPSLECYSFVAANDEDGESWLNGKRQIPFGFGWLQEGASPYRELPVRAIRIACREFWKNPDLSDAEMGGIIGRELFGAGWTAAQLDDTLALLEVFGTDRNWSTPAPLTTPGLVKARIDRGAIDEKKRASLKAQLAKIREIAARHAGSEIAAANELSRIAQWIADQWTGPFSSVL